MSTTLSEVWPAWFANTKFGRELLNEEREQVRARRRKRIAEIAEARAKAERDIPKLKAKVEATADRVEKQRKFLREAESAAAEAYGEFSDAVENVDKTVARAEQELRATAPAAIREFLSSLVDLETVARSSDDYRAAGKILAACRDARTAALGLELADTDPDLLIARIEELRASTSPLPVN